MNQKKIGAFIAECRKRKKLTQLELAEKLGVTDRSVSNWENGVCLPDASLYRLLCEILQISINELFAGEIVCDENYKMLQMKIFLLCWNIDYMIPLQKRYALTSFIII